MLIKMLIKMLYPLKLRNIFVYFSVSRISPSSFQSLLLLATIHLILFCSMSEKNPNKTPTPNSGPAFKEINVALEVKTSQ